MTGSNLEVQVINPLFDQEFELGRFYGFIKQLLPDFNFSERKILLRKEYYDYVESAQYCGSYKGNTNNPLHFLAVYVVKLKKNDSLNKSRTMQRNLIARFLSDSNRIAALTVFYDDSSEWRLSFVKREQQLIRDKHDNITTKTTLSSAKRHSFLVGSERNHTCKSRFSELMEKHVKPSLSDIEEIFNVETVTDEFFDEYKELYLKLKKNLDKILKDSKNSDKKVFNNFRDNNIETSDFAKKLMGQIVFVYFLQKKGWLGVQEGQDWGEGSKDFFKKLYNKEYYDWEVVEESNSFFNNCLEPLFYKGFSYPDKNNYINEFGFKVPFLNGGLFSPIINYKWDETVIEIDNKIFEEIIKVFDRFNFTVREDDPLEKEVAVDPEMLGKVFEKLLDGIERGFSGAFYTPRDVVHYMCKKSLISYLDSNSTVEESDLDIFINNSDIFIERILRFSEDIPIRKNHRIKLPESIYNNIHELNVLLSNVKIADPAVGSGAFPVGMMNEIVNARYILELLEGNIFSDIYLLKKDTIKNSLYCVDIDYSATDITKLRFWLSLVVDKNTIEPLPNLGNNVMCGNSLIDTIDGVKLFNASKIVFDKDDKSQTTLDQNTAYYKLKRINELKNIYFNEKISEFKQEEKEELEKLKWEFIEESYSANGGDYGTITQFKNLDFKPFFIWELEFLEVFSGENNGFDIIIGNPPYVSNKKIKQSDKNAKKEYERIYHLNDDLYNYFFLKSFDLLKDGGVLSFITSNTYFTLNSKLNLRNLFQSNRILELMDVHNVFNDPEVEPAIIIVKKEDSSDDYYFDFIDAKASFNEQKCYNVNMAVYKKAPRCVFFIPSEFNMMIYNKMLTQTRPLLDLYWEKIKDSRAISNNENELNEYRNSLHPGDLSILGLVIEGGQGLATGNNGKYVGVIENSHEANSIIEKRPLKLLESIINKGVTEIKNVHSLDEANSYLNNLSEFEIWELFDSLKEKYDNNLFGQGFLYKIVPENLIFDLDNLNKNIMENGIKDKKCFVPYDKGDKKGNRWFLNTPYYLNWSYESVNALKSSSRARFQNSSFYFKEGFCWNNVLNPNSKYIKARLKSVSVHDVASMSLFPIDEKITAKYIVCLLNSMFLFTYQRTFINNTVNLQLNDFKQLPIIIPTEIQLNFFEDLFDKAYSIKIKYFDKDITKEEHDEQLDEIQVVLDEAVKKLYDIE